MTSWRGRMKAARAGLRARWRAGRVAARHRAQATTCFYCRVPFTGRGAGPDHRTVDHRVPRSRGGSEGLANLVFACFSCNQRKRDRAEDDFVASEWLAVRRAEVAARQDAPESPASRRRRRSAARGSHAGDGPAGG